MSMNVPAALLSMAGEMTGYREQQFAIGLATSYPLEHVLRDSMGFGKPEGFAPPRIVDGTVETRWTSDVVFIADLLGITLDDIRLEWETATPPTTSSPTNVGTYEAGTICAYWWQLFGVVGDRRVVTIEYIASITDDAFMPAHWPRLPEGVSGRDRPHRRGPSVVPRAAHVGPDPRRADALQHRDDRARDHQRHPRRRRRTSWTPLPDRSPVLRDPTRVPGRLTVSPTTARATVQVGDQEMEVRELPLPDELPPGYALLASRPPASVGPT